MNKIIFNQKELKGFLVISNFIFLIFLSYGFKDKNNDYEILNYIVNKNASESICLEENRNNNQIISIVKELQEIDDKGDLLEMDSIKNNYGIQKNEIFENIFNPVSYEHLLKQKDNSNWNFNNIKNPKIKKCKENNNNKTVLYVSKPIYTNENKFALVHITKRTTSYILILQKSKNEWKEYKIIAPMFFQKVKKHIK
ncbi:hypothetical protein [Flavobacterium sp. HNIBRBA15423]|uniref:hypothetical protein n=1 Tax=Flavobacterium sp. HNIBRBA15423 TaxID=3458683 RepID=UPI0040442E6D